MNPNQGLIEINTVSLAKPMIHKETSHAKRKKLRAVGLGFTVTARY